MSIPVKSAPRTDTARFAEGLQHPSQGPGPSARPGTAPDQNLLIKFLGIKCLRISAHSQPMQRPSQTLCCMIDFRIPHPFPPFLIGLHLLPVLPLLLALPLLPTASAPGPAACSWSYHFAPGPAAAPVVLPLLLVLPLPTSTCQAAPCQFSVKACLTDTSTPSLLQYYGKLTAHGLHGHG